MQRITSDVDELGECPTWEPREQRFYWLDVVGKTLQSCRPDGSDRTSRKFDDYPGSFAPRTGGGHLVAFRKGLVLLGPDGAEERRVEPGVVDFAKERFNDGKADSRGRFFVGAMDRRLKNPVGGLFRVDPDLTVTKVSDGYGISNGIAWSPDDGTMYHCDSDPPHVYAYDFDVETGAVANRRIFATFTEAQGHPDGCAMDSEGFLWVAAPGSGCIRRLDPEGREAEILETPVRFPSSIAFGDDDLKTLYITTLQPHEKTPEGGASPGFDGCVFKTRVDVAGLPVGLFKG